ncbi:MAG: CaiB/BaiF CoA transferase family protein [Candidatus Hodarchaeota archaeon]
MKPLEGIKVIDLTKLLPGPFCTMILADLGADIIKVEHPDPMKDISRVHPPFIKGKSNRVVGGLFYQINRNKKSITLNYKKEEGREILLKLIKDADVLVESFKPGTMDYYNLGKAVLKETNPDLVYCSVSGYGQEGYRATEPGHDMNYLSYAGFIHLSGDPDGPPMPFPVPFADYTGALFGAIGVLSALVHKLSRKNLEKNDKGKDQDFMHVDAAIFDSIMILHSTLMGKYISNKTSFKKGEEALSGYYPYYRVYKCKDGNYLSLGAIEEKFWRNFCEAVNSPELIDQQFAGIEYIVEELNLKTCMNFREMNAELERIFLQKDRDEWVEFLNSKNVCCGPVYDLDEVWKDPNIKSRRILKEIDDERYGKIPLLRFPVLYNDQDLDITSAPDHGQHNGEIYKCLGYDESEIKRLKRKRII